MTPPPPTDLDARLEEQLRTLIEIWRHQNSMATLHQLVQTAAQLGRAWSKEGEKGRGRKKRKAASSERGGAT